MAQKPTCKCPRDRKGDVAVHEPPDNTDADRGYPYSYGWLVEHYGLIDWVWELEFADNFSINGVMALDEEGRPVTPGYGAEMSTPPQFKYAHDQALGGT